MAIAIILCLISFSVVLGSLGLGADALSRFSVLYLPPMFFVSATVAWLVRRRPRSTQMVFNIAAGVTTPLVLTSMLLSSFGAITAKGVVDQWWTLTFLLAGSTAVAGLVTYLVLLRPARPKL